MAGNDFTINGTTVQVNRTMRIVYRKQYRRHLSYVKFSRGTYLCPKTREECKQTWLDKIIMRSREAAIRCD